MFKNTDDYNQQAVGETLEVFDVIGVISSFLLFNSAFFYRHIGHVYRCLASSLMMWSS